MNILSDQPTLLSHERVECDVRCNFTFDSNPHATFISLQNEGNSHSLFRFCCNM